MLTEYIKTQTLKYLKVDNKTHMLDEQLNKIYDIIKQHARFKYTYKYFDINPDLKIINTDFYLEGNAIKKHLKDCTQICILACTLGNLIDREISKQSITDISNTVLMDTLANVILEEEKEKLEQIIKKELSPLFITSSYSPGYGDFPISFQQNLNTLLNLQKQIGLTVTNLNLLLPRKSITAIIGISDKKVEGYFAKCNNCVLFDKCDIRKRGHFCGQ